MVLQARGVLPDHRGGRGVHTAEGVPAQTRQGNLLGPGVHDSLRQPSSLPRNSVNTSPILLTLNLVLLGMGEVLSLNLTGSIR